MAIASTSHVERCYQGQVSTLSYVYLPEVHVHEKVVQVMCSCSVKVQSLDLLPLCVLPHASKVSTLLLEEFKAVRLSKVMLIKAMEVPPSVAGIHEVFFDLRSFFKVSSLKCQFKTPSSHKSSLLDSSQQG